MPRPLVALAVAAALALPQSAAAATWVWPLRGPVTGTFRVSAAAPFAAGQRRGIDLAGAPGTPVRAACSGRVRFAGAVPAHGLAVTVVCGRLRATHLGLGSLRVRAGSLVAAGHALGTLGATGRLRLGARRSGHRFGYVDPLGLLAESGRRAPPVLTAPRPAPPGRMRPPGASPLVAPPPPPVSAHALPRAGWIAVGLIASALPLGGMAESRRRRRALPAGRRAARA